MKNYVTKLINGEEWNIYNLELMNEEEKIKVIGELDFKVIKQKEDYKVKDIQRANYRDIESEKFSTIDDIIDRLNAYWDDAFIDFDENLTKESIDTYWMKKEESKYYS